ncbi:MAG: hypothetical protein PF517_12910 [Salinivirgaceae bacterium]|jgi:hypothetical protein|nr:hypothetical protein [Salinivirgaceae bacterium]
MTQEEFKEKLLSALVNEVTPKIERLPHVKNGKVFKVIREINSIRIVDFKAPEFEIFKPHMLLEFRFKVVLDFIYFTGDNININKEQQISVSKEVFGTCNYVTEHEWFKFEYERVRF